MTNTSIKGSFLNNDICFSKMQEENKKCIDFTSKIIDSISKIKSFLTVSGKEYNNYIDKIKRNSSLSKNNFNVLYNYIDIIHDGTFELKGSFSTITTVDNDNDITFDSTKINKNNIKLSSERRLNIYKKLFDICKDSFLEITEILVNLISFEEIVSARENKLTRQNTLSLEKLDSYDYNSLQSTLPHTGREKPRSDNNLIVLNSEKLDLLASQMRTENTGDSLIDEDLIEDENTNLNENTNIKMIPSKIINVNKPKDVNVKLKTNLLYKCDDILEIESNLSKNFIGEMQENKNDDNDTVKEYGNNSFMVKPYKRSKSQDLFQTKNSKKYSRNM
jgi:hypothetical protein